MKHPILYTLILLALYGFTPLEGPGPKTSSTKWLVSKGGSLKVNGSTNVNKFSCAIPSYTSPDTLVLKNCGSNGNISLKGEVSLPVNAFNCGRAMMTADLRKTLKAAEFPRLKIRFISLSSNPITVVKQDELKGMVEIELAGVTKQFEVNYTFTRTSKNVIRMVGERSINFSDFNLTPPKRLGGMVKANNQLSVEFQLNLLDIS